jgi:hypothetical protein
MTWSEWERLKSQEVVVHNTTNVRFRLELKDPFGYWIALEFDAQGHGRGLSKLKNHPESWRRATQA